RKKRRKKKKSKKKKKKKLEKLARWAGLIFDSRQIWPERDDQRSNKYGWAGGQIKEARWREGPLLLEEALGGRPAATVLPAAFEDGGGGREAVSPEATQE